MDYPTSIILFYIYCDHRIEYLGFILRLKEVPNKFDNILKTNEESSLLSGFVNEMHGITDVFNVFPQFLMKSKGYCIKTEI